MKYSFINFISLLFFSIAVKAQGSSSISGVVKDEKSLALPGATVFLTGTKSATACGNDGSFLLDHIAPGSYQIVVKMIGFLPFIEAVNLNGKPVVINISLKPDNFLLKEVKIKPDYDREKHLAIFINEFLGQTYNAEKCKIINPDVLYFNYDKKEKVLTASANDILIIKNNALGYEVKYVITDFKFDENNNVVTYQGYPSFVDIPGTAKQKLLWAKNRKIAYLGSINHFIRSVYNDRVYEEGFEVHKLLNRPMLGIQDSAAKQMILIEEPVIFDSLLTVVNKDMKALTYKDCLYVVYKKEAEPENFTGLHLNITKTPTTEIAHHGQSSLVYLLAKSVNIDKNGLFDPTNGLFFEGYWAWEKNADLMPVEYTAEAGAK